MSTASGRPASRRDPLLPALVGVPVVGAVATLAVQLHLASWDVLAEEVGVALFALLACGWALLPFAAAVVVGVCVHRHWRGGSAAALVGAVLLVAFTAWLLWSVLTDESSTAVLGLLFAPFVQGAVVGVTMAASVAVAGLRRRRAARAGERLRR
ncbi:hypothetical protein [Kineococcus sp. SYSU DK005]|uniref:hypothetical protein n=1 Tax=Kineococcus sp. SYSU DK005 TaxID=3383126 RepID=UPI003D7D5D11